MAVTIAFAIWDRCTMIRPFETNVKKMEEEIAGKRTKFYSLLEAMRELAGRNEEVREVLRKFNLF